MILLGAASSSYFLAELVMAALFPVLLLAGWPAVARFVAAALLSQVWQRGSAAGALREDHIVNLWTVGQPHAVDGARGWSRAAAASRTVFQKVSGAPRAKKETSRSKYMLYQSFLVSYDSGVLAVLAEEAGLLTHYHQHFLFVALCAIPSYTNHTRNSKLAWTRPRPGKELPSPPKQMDDTPSTRRI
jgi:hypothetical protein